MWKYIYILRLWCQLDGSSTYLSSQNARGRVRRISEFADSLWYHSSGNFSAFHNQQEWGSWVSIQILVTAHTMNTVPAAEGWRTQPWTPTQTGPGGYWVGQAKTRVVMPQVNPNEMNKKMIFSVILVSFFLL